MAVVKQTVDIDRIKLDESLLDVKDFARSEPNSLLWYMDFPNICDGVYEKPVKLELSNEFNSKEN